MTNALVPVDQIERMASAVASSGLFGVKTPQQAMALMLVAQAEGLHPAIAARDYHIVQGRPALKADAMLARFQASGGRVQWREMTESRVCAEFSHPQGGTIEIDWTIDMAKRAGLTKNLTWTQYPRAMLRARCVSEGIRTVYPGVVVGTYTPEEIQDAAPQSAPPAPALPPAEPVTFESVMQQIDNARTIDDLNALRNQIRQLDADIRAEATDAAKQRAAQIRATAEATDVQPHGGNDDPI